jgi:nitroreductase
MQRKLIAAAAVHSPKVGDNMNRRTAIIGAGATVATVSAGAGGFAFWSRGGKDAWGEAVETIRRPINPGLTGRDAFEGLVRYATLAANSHNTQAWRFEIGQREITLLPDFVRRTPNVDPDDHHLFASLGAAAENIVQASPVLGLSAKAHFDPEGEGRIIVALGPGKVVTTPMAEAIPKRQCTRSIYDQRPVPAAELQAIVAAGSGEGVELLVMTEQPAIDAIGALIIEGDTAQMRDEAYIYELKRWLRFSYAEAVSRGDGLFSAVSGNPVLPGPIGRLLFDFVASADSENRKYLAQIASSAGLAVFVSEQNDKAHWVAAGRAYQRFALQATALGIKHAFLNQGVEVPQVRQRLAEHLVLGQRRPDLIVRFGYAEEMPRSMRRPLPDVIVPRPRSGPPAGETT